MSKQKLTPLMKFKETIKVNYDSFEDKAFYDFLLAVADKFIKKEKKVISKAYNRGASDLITVLENEENLENFEPVKGIDYYNSKYDLKSFNQKFIEENELQSILESSDNIDDFKKKLRERDLELEVVENKEECKSCVSDFQKTSIVENKIQSESEKTERVVGDSVTELFKEVRKVQSEPKSEPKKVQSEPKSENREKMIEEAVTRFFNRAGVEIKSIKVIKL